MTAPSGLQIVLDTETTGFDPATDRIVEIGCVEIVNLLPTGRAFHAYINPERDVPPEATKVHGLTTERLANEPVFAAVAPDLLAFLANSPIVAHNARFDMGFLDAELTRAALPALTNPVVDTLEMARTTLPGARHTLDALCGRYGVSLAGRALHGALLDAQLLAEVYLGLSGGRQEGLALVAVDVPVERQPARVRAEPLVILGDLAAHAALVATLKDPVWTRYG